jgi:hypothetical protein
VNDKTIRLVIVFFVVMATILIGVAAVALRNLTRSVASNDWVNPRLSS